MTEQFPGIVIFLFGRYFVSGVDMLTRPGFKTTAPLNGVSPFTAAGDADPAMQHLGTAVRANDRVRADVGKDLAARLADSGADYLVVDNSAALLWHREVNSRTYVVLHDEQTELSEFVRGDDEQTARTPMYKVARTGLTDELRTSYDAFVSTCLTQFDPARIVLIRSHAARFWVSSDGLVAPTDVDLADARLLHELDDRFITSTGCQVSDAALSCVPRSTQWHAGGSELQNAIEDDLVEICSSGKPHEHAGRGRTGVGVGVGAETAADHVVRTARAGRDIDETWLAEYFTAGDVSYDDLLALAFLEQHGPTDRTRTVGENIRAALRDSTSIPVTDTRRRFHRSVRALRQWPKRYRPTLPARATYTPQVSIRCGQQIFRFRDSGSIERITLAQIGSERSAETVADGADLDLCTLEDALGSWPVYFARGRKGITAAPTVRVPDVDTLVDSCFWIDWSRVLRSERVVIRTDDCPAPLQVPRSRTDLSFVFDPEVRICTVGGGLMDQVTHIAMFDEICSAIGADYYLDDFRYTWWRSHNGFEASRLAPQLENKRMTNRVSPALLESFRRDIMQTRLPWVFNQSRFWHENGLPDALVVTRDYVNSQRLMQIGPEFPVHVYSQPDDLAGLMKHPPAPVSFFTTQQRIEMVEDSAAAIRRVFSYRHLEAAGLPAEVADAAAELRASPHVALHVRRTDFLSPHFDTDGWFSRQDHYLAAIDHVIAALGSSDVDVAVFSDDLEFVEAHRSEYGLERVTGKVRFIRGNTHYRSIFDSYLMSLCPIIVGSVGFFAATTSLLADPPSEFIRAHPDGLTVEWRRGSNGG